MEKIGGEERMVVGANYWPAEKGISWWREFEVPPLHRDFSLAAEYGLEVIRIFLLWEDFQPKINQVSVPALKDLVRVGVLARSFSDYDSSLWDRPPLDQRVAERFCGLFRRDGSAKTAARLIRDYPREIATREISWDWADIRPEEYREDPRKHLPRLYRRFKDRL
jgi:endo-1,4-beta-mannosidase